MTSLMDRVTLTVKRDTGDGNYTLDGKWVDSPRTEFTIKCNIQPFKYGDTQMVLPDGIKASDTLVLYTRTPLKTASQFDKKKADTAIIDDMNYVAFNMANWARNANRLAHYKVLFVREDRLTNGSL